MFGCTPPPVKALTTRTSPYESVPAASVSAQPLPPVTMLMFLDGSDGFTRHLSGPALAATCLAALLPLAANGRPSLVNGHPDPLMPEQSVVGSAAGLWRNQNAVFSSPLLLVRSPPK